MSRIGALIIAVTLVLSAVASADQVPCELAKRIASDGATSDLFGSAVSISGDVALVGAWRDDDNGTDSGSGYVFRYNGSEWVEEAKLTASDGAAGDYFGYGVISDDIALVGAWRDDDNGTDSGSGYVFRYNGSEWVEEAKLTASDGEAEDVFGLRVGLSGETAIFGALYDDDNGADSGAAYIFRYNGSGWVEEAKLTASDGAAGDEFGKRVDIHGDVVLVAAPSDDDNGADSGAAYIFRYDGSEWVEEAKLNSSDGAAEDVFGNEISLHSDIALIAAPFDDDNGTDSGSAYLFRYDGSGWVEEAKLTAAGGEAGDWFGMSTVISDDAALVGVRYDDDTANEAGSVRVFKYDGSGWNEEAQLLASDGQALDHFGHSVSLSGDIAMVGARDDDDNGSYSGSVYFFGLSDEACSITVDAELTCVPLSGTVPFDTTITVTLTNNCAAQARRIAGHVDVTLANGEHYSNYKAGYTNVFPGVSKVFAWPQTLSNGSSTGANVAVLVVEDVTPAPYNLPPYPPAGDTATASCTVTGIAP